MISIILSNQKMILFNYCAIFMHEVNKFNYDSKNTEMKLEPHSGFLILVNHNQFWIVIKLSRLFRHHTEFRLVSNQLEKWNYNPNYLQFTRFEKLLCVWNISQANKWTNTKTNKQTKQILFVRRR